MVLKSVFAATICATLLAWSGLSAADEYRPDQFIGLDLSKAVLSPTPLGPPQAFAPVAVEAKSDRSESARVVGTEHARPVAVTKIHVAHQPVEKPHVAHRPVEKSHVAHRPSEKPHAVTPTRLARRHGNPLDAQAMDTRIQVWPCKSGGICAWKR
jgi:hypothetical protein